MCVFVVMAQTSHSRSWPFVQFFVDREAGVNVQVAMSVSWTLDGKNQ